METTTSPATATATATAAPATATAGTTTSPAASPAASTPAPATTALDSGASIQAMVDAAAAKGYGGEDLSQAQPATETPAASSDPSATTETQSASPAASETQQQQPTYEYTLERDGHVGARDLASKIEANPALKAALPADIRNELMANARLAEAGSAYRELFSSPAEAKVIAQSAQQHAKFADAFNLVHTNNEQAATNFVNLLIEASAKRDAQGQPMKDANGKFVTDGTANKLLSTLGDRYMKIFVENKVKELGDDNVQAALDLVMESVGLRPSTAKAEDLSPELAQRKAELDAQEARIRAAREESDKRTRADYQSALDGDLDSLYRGEVDNLLRLASGLDSFTRKAVEEKLEAATRQAIKSNIAYHIRRNAIRQSDATADRRRQEVAHAQEFLRSNLAEIARPILTEAGVLVMGKVASRAETQAARAEHARSEVNGGSAINPSRSAVPNLQDPAQQIAAATAEFKAANGGREPDTSELNIYMMLQAARAKGYAA